MGIANLPPSCRSWTPSNFIFYSCCKARFIAGEEGENADVMMCCICLIIQNTRILRQGGGHLDLCFQEHLPTQGQYFPCYLEITVHSNAHTVLAN